MATTSKKALLQVLLVVVQLALLPLSTLGSRAGPSAHHSHGSHGGGHNKHSPPPAAIVSPPPAVVVSPPPAASPASAAQLVRSTCNSTAYYDVCVSALGSDPSSATADVRGLSAIAVSAAAVNASGGAATAAALANGTATEQADGTATAALLRTCAGKYGQARDALAAARQSIADQDYDYASIHVSAAAEYPQVCKALFRRQRPGAYPAELAAREDALNKLCAVALDIINLLSANNS